MKIPRHSRKQEIEFRSLINAVLHETAGRDDLRRLGELLEQHPHLAPRYVDHLVIDTQLTWDALGRVVPANAARQPRAATDSATPSSLTPAASRIRIAKLWGGILTSAAAAVLLAFFLRSDRPIGRPADAVAHVVRLTSHSTTTLKDGDPLGAGVFRLSDGEKATLRFCSGSQLYCEGPCKLDLVSPRLVTLAHGKVTADVPRPAIGFTVLTKRVQVTDLGTRFGVNVDNNEEVDVVVFDGEVNLADREGKVELPEGLFAGEALRVGESERFERLVSIGHDHQSETWDSSWQTDTNLRRSVFTSVTDNLARDSEPHFYGITPRGLIEDARAYSDRVHEWNSLPASPLPAWLKGADLIRRFNSRKYEHSSQLEVNVTVSTDCVLYVLWDCRCKPLAWLKQRFKNTHYIIGMDEGPYRDGVDTLDTGPGKSIDTTYAVWAARIGANEVVRLGPVENEHLAQYKNLYGIAAKPVERLSPEYFPLLFGPDEG